MTKSGHHLPTLSVVGGEKGDQQAADPGGKRSGDPVTQTLRVEAGVSWLCGPFPSEVPATQGGVRLGGLAEAVIISHAHLW